MQLRPIILPIFCLITLFMTSSCQKAVSTTEPLPPFGNNPTVVVGGEPTNYGSNPSTSPSTPTTGTPTTPTDVIGEVTLKNNVLQTKVDKTTPLDMRMLIISAKSTDTALGAVTALLEQVGVPYEILIATTETTDQGTTPEEVLVESKLIAKDASGAVRGRFQGIILTEAALAFDKNEGSNQASSFVSAFNEDEWNLLWQYERDIGVRQVAWTTFPSNFPEDYGLSYVSPVDTTNSPLNINLSNAGQDIFKSLQKNITIPVRYAYTYLAKTNPASQVSSIPLLVDSAGNTVGVLSTSKDGRERIALTMAHNPYLLHTQLFGYDILNWLSQGVFLGERRMYLTVDVDDYFLESSLWNPATNSDFAHEDRVATMKTSDIYSAKANVETIRNNFPLAQDFNYVMIYNGYLADLEAKEKCTADATITEATLCVRNFFDWVSHTLNHELMDGMDYAQSRNEFEENLEIGQALGLNLHATSLVTGNHSGLGWSEISQAPDGVGCKYDQVTSDKFCQFGLEHSNKAMLDAARDLDIKYLAGNRGWLSHVAECDSCLIQHPLEPSIQIVPRWPTNIYYNVRTPEENVSEFNYLYGPNGVSKDGNGNVFFKENQTWAQVLELEADLTLRHIMSASPYPHFFHQANIHEYAPGRSLLFDWSEAVLKRYSNYFAVPILVQDWPDLTQTLEERDSFYNASATGVWNRVDNSVDVTAKNAATVFVTGVRSANASSFSYGEAQVAKLELAAGQSSKATVIGISPTVLPINQPEVRNTPCIGNLVWNDTNQNAIQDNGETGIAGVTLELYKEVGSADGVANGNDSLVATLTTDEQGNYEFCNLEAHPSYYVLKLTDSAGVLANAQMTHSPLLSLALLENQRFEDANFGYLLP